METPLVSIIIVNYSGKNLLKNCLESIARSLFKDYEIIVVDNNSTDDSVEFVKQNFSDVQILELNKNFGFSVPNNMAAKIAKGKYLVFLNNDTKVTPDWLSELVTVLESDKKIVIGQSLLVLPDGKIDSSGDFLDKHGRAFSATDTPEKIRFILSARAASMIIRRDVFLDLGGFDESYFASFEDVELGWKAWLWGYKVVVIPKSIVYHIGGQTTKQLSETIAFHGIKNNIVLRLTNFEFSHSISSIFWMSSIVFAKKLFGVSMIKNVDDRFKIPNFKVIVKACFWILQNSLLISKKRKILKSRKIVSNEKLREMGLIKSVGL